MLCDHCKRPMTALLLSYVCDYCDELRSDTTPYRGFVVYRGRGRVREEYVFRSRRDAERWREMFKLDDCEVREVESAHEFRWRVSNGRVKDLELADRLFEIFPDHRYEPAPRRAHIAC
jgi:hypothetical protein